MGNTNYRHERTLSESLGKTSSSPENIRHLGQCTVLQKQGTDAMVAKYPNKTGFSASIFSEFEPD